MKTIILAGGSGTRLWPLSRTYYPKQFLKLKNMHKSVFQMAFERSLKLTNLNEIYIVTGNSYRFLILDQIQELGYKIDEGQILLEPSSKNTLPAIYYGVKKIQKQGEDIVVVFPSDHLMPDEEKLITIIKKGEQLASEHIITFGIKPNKPHTSYGYIKPGTLLEAGATGYRAEEFKEKPDQQTAQTYLEKGYLWNSGMFMFKTDIFTTELKQHNPGVYWAFEADSIEEIYQKTSDISIDYGIMEKSRRVAVIPLDITWTDLGSFDAFYDEFTPDDKGNIAFNGDILIDSGSNLLYSDRNKAVALIGVNDLIIVDEKDALLICKKDQSQKVREVVKKLKAMGDHRADYHPTVYRPWGSYTILEEGLFYKVKRIAVLPGKKLSYQSHHHRSEHWVVVKGTARVMIEDKEFFVKSGESTYVQAENKHRLENPGKALLEVIEVQLGEYLGEDDIVRFDDDFGRCE